MLLDRNATTSDSTSTCLHDMHGKGCPFCHGFPQNFNSYSSKLNLIHCRLTCYSRSPWQKKLKTVSVCYYYSDFFLSVLRAAVTWANALKHDILIDNSFFYETWISLKYYLICSYLPWQIYVVFNFFAW